MGIKKVVEILAQKTVFRELFFRIEETKLRHQTFKGEMSDQRLYLTLHRGDGAAVILHDPSADVVILVEQFRYATYAPGFGWTIELPAGIINEGETPAETIRREILEETGYKVATLDHVMTFFVSPGGASERIFLYYAIVKSEDQVSSGGGLGSEHEDIRILSMKIEDALHKLASGEIIDAKTIIGLQWLQLRKINDSN